MDMPKNFIILESQLQVILESDKVERMVFAYLDDTNWYVWDFGDEEFNVSEGEYGLTRFRYRIQSSSTFPDREFDFLYISIDLVESISNLFSISMDEATNLTIKWFNKGFDTDLDINSFEWMDQDDEWIEGEDNY